MAKKKTLSVGNWQNRIVRHENVAPDQLLANNFNFRVHSKLQQDVMEAILSDIGWIEEVIVNERTGRMVNGHMRVTLALRHDEPTVPVKIVDLDENEEIRAILLFDQIGSYAGADRDVLQMAIQEVVTQEGTIAQAISDLATQHRLALPEHIATLLPGAEVIAQATEPAPGGSVTREAAPASAQPHASLPEANVRQVAMFMDPEMHSEFLSLHERLSEYFQTETLSETAIAAYRHLAEELL